MSKVNQTIRVSPLRPMQEFLGGNEWTKPKLDPTQLDQVQKQIITNLIYYQTNYGAFAIPFLLFITFLYPTATIFALFVVAGLVYGYSYSARQKPELTVFLRDRPIVTLFAVLVAAFIIVRLFDTTFAFLAGIAFPLALTIVHAAVRTPASEANAATTDENLPAQSTPMGYFLVYLGAKLAEEPATTPSAKRK